MEPQSLANSITERTTAADLSESDPVDEHAPDPQLDAPPARIVAAEPLFSAEPQPVDPRHVPVTRIGSWIVAAFFIVGGLVSVIIITVVNWPPGLPALIAGCGWVALTCFFTWLAHSWPAIAYRHVRYIVTEQGLEIRRGVVWKTVISMPKSRVQHTDVVQGPIQRRYGIATLVAHTAGTRNATVSLEGLSRERAMQIRDFLLQGEADDTV